MRAERDTSVSRIATRSVWNGTRSGRCRRDEALGTQNRDQFIPDKLMNIFITDRAENYTSGAPRELLDSRRVTGRLHTSRGRARAKISRRRSFAVMSRSIILFFSFPNARTETARVWICCVIFSISGLARVINCKDRSRRECMSVREMTRARKFVEIDTRYQCPRRSGKR